MAIQTDLCQILTNGCAFFHLFVCDSGDADTVIPITSTRYSIDALKLPAIGPWRAWYDDGEVSNV